MLSDAAIKFQEKYPPIAKWDVACKVAGLLLENCGEAADLLNDLQQLLPGQLALSDHGDLGEAAIDYLTPLHPTALRVLAELRRLGAATRAALSPLGGNAGLRGTIDNGPIERSMSGDDRPRVLLKRFGSKAPTFAMCSLQVHVGVSRDTAISVINCLNKLTPLLVAISARSPSLLCVQSKAARQRDMTWKNGLLKSGWPHQWRDWNHLESYVADLARRSRIAAYSDPYWMVRPTRYGTIDVRACEMPPSLNRAAGIAVLVQAAAIKSARPHLWQMFRGSAFYANGFLVFDQPVNVAVRARLSQSVFRTIAYHSGD